MSNPLLTEDIGIHFIDMDTFIDEQVIHNEDGSYSIFLNARKSNAQQMLAYQHAIKHIMEDDFRKVSADKIELYAHKPE